MIQPQPGPSDTHDIALLPHQWDAWEATRDCIGTALVTGLGAGKTFLGSRFLVSAMLENPETTGLATANSYRQLHDVLVPELMRACEQFGVPFTWRKVDAMFTLHLGDVDALILCRTTEIGSVDRLRGLEIGRWWGDEVRDASGYALDVIFGRLRCRQVDRPCYLWTSTPNGFDHIYERHVERSDPNYRLVHARSDDNPYLPSQYLTDVLGSYDAQMARQERGGEFLSVGIGQAYHAFRRADHVISSSVEPGEIVLTCDFNIGRMAWIVCQARSGGEVHVLAEITGHDVYDTAETLAGWLEEHAPGQRVLIYGDPAGSSRDHAGRTDYARMREYLTDAGINHAMRVAGSHPRQRDRVNAVNALLSNARGELRLFIDEGCDALRRDFEQVRWLETGKGLDKRDERLTHASDALGYYIHAAHRPEAFKRQPNYRMAGVARSGMGTGHDRFTR